MIHVICRCALQDLRSTLVPAFCRVDRGGRVANESIFSTQKKKEKKKRNKRRLFLFVTFFVLLPFWSPCFLLSLSSSFSPSPSLTTTTTTTTTTRRPKSTRGNRSRSAHKKK